MRIVAGSHRGRRLAAPPGALVRPTAERVREAVFNILVHRDFGGGPGGLVGARVVDAFAGTGAMGLEALSRGAADVIFIENDRAALTALRANLRGFGEEGRARVIDADCLAPPRAPAPADLAFLDPPYRAGLEAPALRALRAAGWIGAGTLVTIELAAREPFTAPDGFDALDERRYGAARVVFLRAV